jgi:hypothetical protein
MSKLRRSRNERMLVKEGAEYLKSAGKERVCSRTEHNLARVLWSSGETGKVEEPVFG